MAPFSLKQETIETFAANATQQAMMVHRRVNQKKKQRDRIRSSFEKNERENYGI